MGMVACLSKQYKEERAPLIHMIDDFSRENESLQRSQPIVAL